MEERSRRGFYPIIVSVLAILAVALAVLFSWLFLWRERERGRTGEETITVECGIDDPATFLFRGQEHEVRLLEVVGSSARVVFSSDSPSEITLTEGRTSEVDLDADAIYDASVTLDQVSSDRVRLVISAPAYRAWDESGFVTQGGLRPYNYQIGGDFAVVTQDDSYLLLYVSVDRKLNWERYTSEGALITDPEMQVGVLEPGTEGGKVYGVDGVSFDGRVALAMKTESGVRMRVYDADLHRGGQPLHIGKNMESPEIAVGGGRAYVVSVGEFDPPRGGGKAVIVTEVGLQGNPVILRQDAVGGVEAGGRYTCCDAALDEETGRLLVLLKRLISNTNEVELLLLGVDLQTFNAAWVSTVSPREEWYGRNGCLVASGGTAVMVWYRGYRMAPQHDLKVSSVDVESGEMTELWSGRRGQSSPFYQGISYECELVQGVGGGQPCFAYFDPFARRDASARISSAPHRFILWPWEGDQWASSGIVLEGGKPILADPLIDLNSFEQAPAPAVCGAPVALKGKVVNRGGRSANQVVVTASVGGQEIGRANLGNIKAASSVYFSIIWEIPPDYTGEEVEVSFALTTSSQQYTTGNDSATHVFNVRQKGLVSGRVVDASSDVRHRTGWYPGLANARVTIGDRTVLTDIAGTFQLEGLEFGTYQVVVEREGYNRLETEVTVSRTKPLAFVSAELDNHGVITLRVVDETGKPLEGVDVYLHEYETHERTPAGGELTWDISRGVYTFSFVKRGYQALGGQEVEVVMGEERTQTITMREASTALLAGRVVDQFGAPVGGATVTIRDQAKVVAGFQVSPGGGFEAVELSAKPSKAYEVEVTGNGVTVTERMVLYGGDDIFYTFWLVPERGERRIRSFTQGYTSWMVKAGWPGLGEIAGADMYAWFGNYAICVGAEYWSGTRELAAVDVSVWGGAYESHATKSEVDFSGWFEPPETGSVFDITTWADIPGKLVSDHPNDVLDIADVLINGFDEDADEYVITGQGNEILTWKEARKDFAPELEFDSSDPLGSMWNVVDAVPKSFAIPLVIGGSSVEQTAVRVDKVDVVRLGTGQPVELGGASDTWYSFQGPEGTENNNGKSYQVQEAGVPFDEVIVYVWITIQKYRGDAPMGTCFDQREKQVVIFKPGPQSMKGYIAPGDLYCNPSMIKY